MPYEMPAVCVSRSAIVIARRAGTVEAPASPFTATVVFANAGNEPAHGHVWREAALFHQGEDGRARERLGLRGNAEDRIDPHRAVRFLVAPPQRPFVNRLAVPQRQDNDARDAVLIDVLLQHRIQAFETLPGDAVNRRAAGLGVACWPAAVAESMAGPAATPANNTKMDSAIILNLEGHKPDPCCPC